MIGEAEAGLEYRKSEFKYIFYKHDITHFSQLLLSPLDVVRHIILSVKEGGSSKSEGIVDALS